MRGACVLFLFMALVLSACGGSDKSKQAGKCVILANGNKLCGADAKAYCERFGPNVDDQRSIDACRSVGVPIPKTPAERQAEEEDRVQREAAKDRRRQAAAAELRPVVGKIAGSALLAVERDPPNRITVETFWSKLPRSDWIEDTTRSAPPATLKRICEAIHKRDPRARVTFTDREDPNGSPLMEC